MLRSTLQGALARSGVSQFPGVLPLLLLGVSRPWGVGVLEKILRLEVDAPARAAMRRLAGDRPGDGVVIPDLGGRWRSFIDRFEVSQSKNFGVLTS